MFKYYEYDPILCEDEYIPLTSIECNGTTILFKTKNHIIATNSFADVYLIFGNDFTELKGYLTRPTGDTDPERAYKKVSFTLTTTDSSVLRNLYNKINATVKELGLKESPARIESKVYSQFPNMQPTAKCYSWGV